MPFRNSLFVACLLSLFLVPFVQAQSLSDAKTMADVAAYVNQEAAKLDSDSMKPEELATKIAGLLIPAADKILEFALTPEEKTQAYNLKMSAFSGLVQAEVEGAEQKFETFLDELAAQDEFAAMAEFFRFRLLALQMVERGIEGADQKLIAFLHELEAKEKNAGRVMISQTGRFLLFGERAKKAETTPENFVNFITDLKDWLIYPYIPVEEIAMLGFEVVYRYKVPAEQFVKEFTEYIRTTPEFVVGETKVNYSAAERKELIDAIELALRLAPGVDPKLYGKTLDDKDFDWQTLRGKYVLIKFTATWCGPCKKEIPGMLEAYTKYKEKGLEIVSVYISEPGADPAASVKKAVEEAKLPWIILSEALTANARQPGYGEFYGIESVPTFVLVDKEGKIMPLSRGDWKKKLGEIFDQGNAKEPGDVGGR